MIFRRHKLTLPEIAILGGIGAAFIAVSNFTFGLRPMPAYDEKKAAAVKTAGAFSVLKEYRLRNGIEIDSLDDQAESGIIGVNNSFITTEEGDLESKCTSVNPNWAAAIVDMMIKAGVKKGDAVCIGMSGSFPALNIAAIVAAESYGAVPYWIVSLGSSAWGANIPRLTWLDMEKILYDKQLLHGRAIAASLGGGGNVGGGLGPDARDTLRAAIKNHGVPLMETTPLSSFVGKAMERYMTAAGPRRVAMYITIGGGIASLGTSRVADVLKPGINTPRALVSLGLRDEPVQGVVALFMARGVPVANFLNIVPLARKYGLPIAPCAPPAPGIGELFFGSSYHVWTNAALLIVYCLLVMGIGLGVTDIVFKNPRRKGPEL